MREAQNQLRSGGDTPRTMLAIALDSGFNSESVFYKQFKKYTALTPRQYQAQHRAGQ